MAKKTAAVRKHKVGSTTTWTVGPFAAGQAFHVHHLVHVHLAGKACYLHPQAPGFSASPAAYNMAPGFEFTIKHKKRKNKPCELTIHQGPFVAPAKLAVAAGPPPKPVCDGVEGCEIDCPDFDLPIANCITLACEAPPGVIRTKKK